MNFTCCNGADLQLDFELCYILQVIAIWFRLDGPHCIFGQLIFRKIVKIVATRGQILKAKMHQIRLRLRLRPRRCWGSFQRSPRQGRGDGPKASTS